MKNLSWYIAFRYFISKKSTQAVSIIMYTSLTAIAIATCAMFVILSVFSGLESFNIKLFSDVNPDLRVLPATGKTLPDVERVEKILSSHSEVKAFTKVIEEKVYVLFYEKDEIAYLKGVDENFLKVVKIDTCFQAGKFPNTSSDNEAAFGNALAYRLGVPIDKEYYASLYMPKPGKKLISNTDDAFKKATVHMTGVFALNDQYENYIFVPIQLSRNLLNLPPNSAFSIELKVKNNVKSLQKQLKDELGKNYIIQNRQEQDASFLKMMKVEQLFIYLIFILVIIIASFNLAGAIIIIILDKKYQSKSLIALGYSISGLKKLFFTIGIIITMFGVVIGIVLGTFLTWLQSNFGLVMANPFMPFPVKFDLTNYLIVLITVLFIGFSVSFLSSRKLNF
ncbi:FtsX-like permease family protein [Apibacter sp. B3889]|uniref:ABC transporter permease n=1 Tax=unclassified Apibacter TaxID=2630820 RepID=UPI0013228468|nr:FtsX-like permease family protein [Apibacter sp. B3883]MXO40955.1 FtsX-like permease family protein [Apibacter sp. B3889]MXP04124.1 FtsX-like permease family protein [Apibacter sp. B3887]MXP07065.1 FtsX-like permease family protein [Apibacter sp. B3935]